MAIFIRMVGALTRREGHFVGCESLRRVRQFNMITDGHLVFDVINHPIHVMRVILYNESTIDSEGFKGGTRGSPIMPRDAVSRTANVGTVGTNSY